MNRITVDSNIYVSALIFGGKPFQLLELAIDGEIEIAVSDALVEETLRTMREKLRRTPDQLVKAEGYITAVTRRVTPTETIDAVPTDADDNRVLECAVVARSDTIVTGDTDLLQLGSFRGIEIVRVADFLARFSGGNR